MRPERRGLQGCLADRHGLLMTQHGDGEGDILDLMRAGQAWHWHVDMALFVAIMDPVAIDGGVPGGAHGEP